MVASVFWILNLKIMKKLIVGIDVSKDKLDYCILDQDYHVIRKGVIANNQSAITKWLESLELSCIEVVLEHTGHYGALLAWLLSENHVRFYMLNPLELKNSMGIQRGKTDAVDAYRIAAYATGHKHKMQPYILPDKELRQIKALMAARERYIKIGVQLKNSLKANNILHQTVDVSILIREEQRQIRAMEKSIRLIEKQLSELIKSSKELEKSYEKIIRITGVGSITAIKCIAETDNFLKFTNARKFSCHCGLAPFPYQSGSSVRGRSRTHYLSNKSLKSTLFKAACSAIQHDPQLKLYYHRKRNEGKHKLSVLNAVANKLVLRIFAVVKREEPFVKLAA